ncbi:TldD/PmbA family protein [Oscillatoria salina]|uniref:TldD/PmbA family protein n=1 Tax=Oscillatoria salina TaxID=331517 RepID=UPI001CC8F6FB|nr:TldD/PmbA family protein [Oscillatoria salina]
MKDSRITKLGEQLLELATKSGAEYAEVYQSSSLSKPAIFEANRLKQLEVAQSEGTALRLWRNNCPGLAVAYGQVDPQALVEKAIALSQLNPPETPELASPKTAVYPDFGTNVEVEELIKIGKIAIARIRELYPEVLCSAEFECEAETTCLLNSQGLHCQYTDLTLSSYLGVEWVRGDDFLGIYDGQEARNELKIDQIVKDILQKLTWAITNTESPKGKLPVLFTPKAATLLWSVIGEATNGKRVVEASSPWSEILASQVVSECLSISQQPDIGPYSCPFDDEGTLTQSFTLIEKGKLKQFYSDRATGRALGMNSTGNGFRPGLGRYPTPDLVNFLIEPGQGSLPDLIANIDEGIVIDQILGGGADISGDFSVNIDLGYRIKNGEIVGRVKDTMVAGNVYTALKQVIALGGDATWNGSSYTPSIVVNGLSVVSS